MYWIVDLSAAFLLFLLVWNAKLVFNSILKPFLKFIYSLLAGKLLETSMDGSYRIRWGKIWQRILLVFSFGALFCTLPALYLGYVLSWLNDRDQASWFWIETFILGFIVLVLLLQLGAKKFEVPVFSFRKTFKPLAILVLIGFVSFVIGYILVGCFWWGLGTIALERAKRDVAAAGFSFEEPQSADVLDDQNALTYLKKASDISNAVPVFNGVNSEERREFYSQKRKESQLLGNFVEKINGSQNFEPTDLQAWKKFLKSRREILELVATAFQTKSIYFKDINLDYQRNPNYQYRDTLRFLQDLRNLLMMQAFVQIEDGKQKAALTSLREGLFIGTVFRKTYTPSEAENNATESDLAILNVADQILSKVNPSLIKKEFLPDLDVKKIKLECLLTEQEELFATKQAGDVRIGYFSTLIGGGFSIYEGVRGHLIRAEQIPSFLFYFLMKPFLPYHFACNYERGIQDIKALELPFSQRRLAIGGPAYWRSGGWFSGENRRNYTVDHQRFFDLIERYLLTRALTEARIFYIKHHQWPKAMAELEADNGNEKFPDPYSDNKELKIKETANGIFIYSLGQSGRDVFANIDPTVAAKYRNNVFQYQLTKKDIPKTR